MSEDNENKNQFSVLKKIEATNIALIILAPIGLASWFLQNKELNETSYFLFTLSILFGFSAYTFWYLTDLANFQMQKLTDANRDSFVKNYLYAQKTGIASVIFSMLTCIAAIYKIKFNICNWQLLLIILISQIWVCLVIYFYVNGSKILNKT